MAGETCSICYKDIDSLYAKINSCNHLYCEDCIVKWSETENSCPLCRKTFTQIITKNENIDVEWKRQEEEDEDSDDDLIDLEQTIDEMLQPYEIGTIVKKRNTKTKNRFRYVIYKRYFITFDIEFDHLLFITQYGNKLRNNENIFDVHFCNFDYPCKIIEEVENNGCSFWELRDLELNNGHSVNYNDGSPSRNTSHLHFIDIEVYSLHKTYNWWLPNESSPICAIICPETSWYNIQKTIIVFLTKRQLKLHSDSIKNINKKIYNKKCNKFKNSGQKNLKDTSHFQRNMLHLQKHN